jgi:hypothetical protein
VEEEEEEDWPNALLMCTNKAISLAWIFLRVVRLCKVFTRQSSGGHHPSFSHETCASYLLENKGEK